MFSVVSPRKEGEEVPLFETLEHWCVGSDDLGDTHAPEYKPIVKWTEKLSASGQIVMAMLVGKLALSPSY